ncbi:DUF6126 family protein [Streptomyces sp. NPDC021093]|uniref:DUF6126 family protein n=1 Tax=Streptomyces sp. NPDC021093 TaxID=3365112 RepID=UPI00378AA776
MNDERPGRPVTQDSDRWETKGLVLRVFFYVAGTHLLAGFLYLLFYLGEHAQK